MLILAYHMDFSSAKCSDARLKNSCDAAVARVTRGHFAQSNVYCFERSSLRAACGCLAKLIATACIQLERRQLTYIRQENFWLHLRLLRWLRIGEGRFKEWWSRDPS